MRRPSGHFSTPSSSSLAAWVACHSNMAQWPARSAVDLHHPVPDHPLAFLPPQQGQRQREDQPRPDQRRPQQPGRRRNARPPARAGRTRPARRCRPPTAAPARRARPPPTAVLEHHRILQDQPGKHHAHQRQCDHHPPRPQPPRTKPEAPGPAAAPASAAPAPSTARTYPGRQPACTRRDHESASAGPELAARSTARTSPAADTPPAATPPRATRSTASRRKPTHPSRRSPTRRMRPRDLTHRNTQTASAASRHSTTIAAPRN